MNIPIAGVDFVELSVEESFSPSEMMRYILIPIINDDTREEIEQFTVQLSLPSGSRGVVLDRHLATVWVVDEDREFPRITFYGCTSSYMCSSFPGVRIQWEATAYTVSEGSEVFQLVLLKEGETTFDAAVEITTVAINAIGRQSQHLLTQVYLLFNLSAATQDYMMLSETVSFGASNYTSVVSVVVVNDDVLENEEVFVVSLSEAIGQQRVDFAPHNATVSITNDDGTTMSSSLEILLLVTAMIGL